MVGGGGGGSTDSTTYTNLIPTYIPGMQAWAVQYLADALALSVANFVPYPGETYAPQDINEIYGALAMAYRGAGSDIEADGETHLQKLYDGGYLGTSPYLDDTYQKLVDELKQAMEESTLPSIRDAHAFSFGGSEHNAEETKAAQKAMEVINSITDKVYYDDHRTERRVQDAGLSHAVPFGQRGIRDAEMLRQAGLYAREYLQGSYADNWNKWNENQILPIRNLNIVGNAIRTILGTTRSVNTTYYKPPAMSQIAGLALTGMGIYGLWNKTTMSVYQNPAGNKIQQPAQQAPIDVIPMVQPQLSIPAPQIEEKPTLPTNQEDWT
jgi:hypothetical protein